MKFVKFKDKDGREKFKVIMETQEEIDELNEERKWWKENGCNCKEKHDTYFIPDGVSKVCDKHHWICSKCKKVVQIG